MPNDESANPEHHDELVQVEPEETIASDADEAEVSEELSVEFLQVKLAEANAKINDQKDSVLRAQAEMQNLRRRTERDVENAHKFALEKFSGDLLPVVDSLERALQSAADEDGLDDAAKVAFEGVELTLKMLLDALKKHGVEQLDPTGEPFNPEFHEAMSMQPNPDMEPNSVMMVLQKGYRLNSRLVRPAMVVVSKAV